MSSYLEKEENITYAVSGSCAEWNVSKRMSVLHSLGQKVVWIEVFGVGEHFWITVDNKWQNRNLCSGGNSVILCNKSKCDSNRNMAPAASTQCHSEILCIYTEHSTMCHEGKSYNVQSNIKLQLTPTKKNYILACNSFNATKLHKHVK